MKQFFLMIYAVLVSFVASSRPGPQIISNPSPTLNVAFSTPSASSAGSLGSTVMATAGTSGNKYLFGARAVVTAVGVGCTGSTSVQIVVSYTDNVTSAAIANAVNGAGSTGGASLNPFITVTNGVVGNTTEWLSVPINAKASSAVSYSTTYTLGGGCTTGPSYYIQPVLLQIS